MNNADLKKIISDINNVWKEKYLKDFKDINNKEPLFNFIKELNQVNGVTNVSLNGEKKKIIFRDFDGDKSYFYEYPLIIMINNIKIVAKINIIPKNEFYNFVLCLKMDTRIMESLGKSNDSIHFRQFIRDLRKCSSFSDIKLTVKKYYREGAILGILLTVVLCNYSLSPEQYNQLAYIDRDFTGYYYENNDMYCEGTPDEDAAESTKIVPDWELLCNDVIATVYHAVEEQCNKDVNHTACMFKLNLKNPESHRIIAMERTMMKEFGLHFGDFVKIEGAGNRDGVYQIQDVMNARFAGQHKIDILVNLDTKTGKWENVSLYKLINQNECHDMFKVNMADALNQKSIDKRQRKNRTL